MAQRYVDVAVFPHRIPIVNRAPPAYTYLVPDDWPDTIDAGHFVLAPFGYREEFDRLVSGVVVRLVDQPPELIGQLKSLEALLHATPVVSRIHLDLAQWMSDAYLEPLSNCVRLFAPPGQSIHSDIEYALQHRDAVLPALSRTQADLIDFLRARGPQRAGQIHPAFRRRDWKTAVDSLVKQGWVTRRRVLPLPTTRPKRVRYIHLTPRAPDLDALPALARSETDAARRRRTVLVFLQRRDAPVDVERLLAETGVKASDLAVLHKRGLIAFSAGETLRDPLAGKSVVSVEPPKLTSDQQAVWSEVEAELRRAAPASRTPFLLHGITGSGKTEIYLRAVAETLSQGRQALVLVPEIGLTAQTINRFAARFRERLGVWHSELSLNERYDTWRRVQMGLIDVVIGTRSALFVPLDRLGLIVIDEEHDASFKQSPESDWDIPIRWPLYHVRDVAPVLARLSGATLIMGSATPSLESYTRAQRGEFRLLSLPRRVLGHAQRIRDQAERHKIAAQFESASDEAFYRELPPVEIVDLRAELKAGNTHIFSRRLQAALQETLSNGEQAILFLNRRGQATFVSCRDCGHVLRCPRCDTPLTYHEPAYPQIDKPANLRTDYRTTTLSHHPTTQLLCHTCNHREKQPAECPQCGSRRIRYFGAGTQKVEAAVRELFPDARVLRWDRDTTAARGKTSHEAILQRFVDGQADVLVGTQMIAKGLDLPLVTLVGVVSADTVLNLPDFRSGERTFQLLAQVAGRAGRGLHGGRAIVQTYRPDHYAIDAAAGHDYASFAAKELAFRRERDYPPVRRLARLIVREIDADKARRAAEHLAAELDAYLTRRGLGRESIIGPAPCFFARIGGRWRWHILVRADDPAALLHGFPVPSNWRIDLDPLSVL